MPRFVLPGSSAGLLKRGNIDIDARTYVAVPVGHGMFASVRSTSWHLEPNELVQREKIRRAKGAEVLVPEVIRVGHQWKAVGGKRALEHYRSTGRHLGIFDTPGHATAYANRLHLMQAAAVKRRRR